MDLTPETTQKILKLRAEGVFIKAIAAELGVSVWTVRLASAIAATKAPATPEPVKTPLDAILLRHLKTGGDHTVENLADRFEVTPKLIREAVERLKAGHYLAGVNTAGRVSLGSEPAKRNSHIRTEDFFPGRVIRFGALGDTHLGSRYERLDCLQAIYDVYEREGITQVYHTGNFIDGEARFNKNDLHVHGMGNQLRYFCNEYPKREGIHTSFIAGDDHEGWYVQREGIDVGQVAHDMARNMGRDDLTYLGYMEHDVTLQAPGGSAIMRIVHPGGGSAYAISYTTQKLVESLSGGEKPQIMLLGHYHKSEYIYYRNIHCIQTGCFMDQSPFMRKKRLAAHVGGWIVEATQAEDGSIVRFRQEWIPFYDQAHYRAWSYRMDTANAAG